MNWKTLAALAVIAVMAYVVMAAISFGERVGDTWSDATTTTVTNGLVMICFGGAMFGIFIISMIVSVALAARLLAIPRQSQPERPRGWNIPRGWDDNVVDSTGERGRITSIESPIPGLRPMLPANNSLMLPAMPSGAFDAMEDNQDRRFKAE